MEGSLSDLLRLLQSTSNAAAPSIQPPVPVNTGPSLAAVPLRQAPQAPRPAAALTPLPDVTKINTYPAALRYIFALYCQYPHVLQRVKSLKTAQEKMERDWYMKRHRLLQKFKSQDELNAILKPFTGAATSNNSNAQVTGSKERSGIRVDPSTPSNVSGLTPEQEQELLDFDKNVVNAFDSLHHEQLEELSRLRIPMFLSTSEDSENEERKKVLQLLQDLLGD
ncbi:fungal protein [Schizosaccharomyces japonicus yFS275]|uniref:Fungal protein n=1 Tax=Schizosaccharomyces japonicus (strain yFS275 / FY16936) TaxID=402676 RepID=B6K6W3_SCHJY|nr:fungal protein [Schizosaccharomyces japonicus yFS275]EEB09267.1 fungal protein [Schizosaccharomyces japonicus yFS275]